MDLQPAARPPGPVSKALDALPTTCVLAIKGGRTVYEYGDPAEVGYLASARKPILSLLYGRPVTDGVINLESTLDDLGIDDVQAGPLGFQDFDPARRRLLGRSEISRLLAHHVFLSARVPSQYQGRCPERMHRCGILSA